MWLLLKTPDPSHMWLSWAVYCKQQSNLGAGAFPPTVTEEQWDRDNLKDSGKFSVYTSKFTCERFKVKGEKPVEAQSRVKPVPTPQLILLKRGFISVIPACWEAICFWIGGLGFVRKHYVIRYGIRHGGPMNNALSVREAFFLVFDSFTWLWHGFSFKSEFTSLPEKHSFFSSPQIFDWLFGIWGLKLKPLFFSASALKNPLKQPH